LLLSPFAFLFQMPSLSSTRSPVGANKDQNFFKPEVLVLACLMYES
jgi:hypothetical protein